METFAERLARLIKAEGITGNEFARRVGKTSGYISLVLQGRRLPDGNLKTRDAPVWADALGVEPRELTGGDAAALARPHFLTTPLNALLNTLGATRLGAEEVRLVQKVSAGTRGGDSSNGAKKRRRRLYVVEVEGDCMVPEIKNGDLVKFDPDLSPEDGDWVVATIEGERAVVKSLEIKGAVQRLLPINGEPLIIDENVRIVGVVVSREEPAPRFRKRR